MLITILVPTKHPILFQNDIYYACPYVFSSRHHTFHFIEENDRTGVIRKLYFAPYMRLGFITHPAVGIPTPSS
jgi:hypothetical protein